VERHRDFRGESLSTIGGAVDGAEPCSHGAAQTSWARSPQQRELGIASHVLLEIVLSNRVDYAF
jgi:hypothetical protein